MQNRVQSAEKFSKNGIKRASKTKPFRSGIEVETIFHSRQLLHT